MKKCKNCNIEINKLGAYKYCSDECKSKFKKNKLEIEFLSKIVIDYDKIQDKKYLYEFIDKHRINFLCISSKKLSNDEKLRLFLKRLGLNNFVDDINNITFKQLYDDVFGEKICQMCGKPSKFNFKKGYNINCSNECYLKKMSNDRKGLGNPIHRISDENRIKWKLNCSEGTRKGILNGTFTPKITNSWCHSRTKIIIKNKIVYVRSSWEAFFYIKNPNLQYEKLRIPYEHNNQTKIYLVDFIDYENKMVYEIKN